jgi:hypothetical protein
MWIRLSSAALTAEAFHLSSSIVSGGGFMPSNSNAATSDSKLSVRDVPMTKAFAKALC